MQIEYVVAFSFSFLLGTIAIDLDRKMVFNEEKDANIWKPPTIDREEVEEVKKYSSPAHQVRHTNLSCSPDPTTNFETMNFITNQI